MAFTLNKTKQTISGMVNFQSFALPYDEVLFKELTKLEDLHYYATSFEELTTIEKKAMSLINDSISDPTVAKEYSDISKNLSYSNGKYYLIGRRGVISKIPIPQPLVDKIIDAYLEGLSVEPYVKCWTLFLKNPNFSIEKAELFANYLNAKFFDKVMYDELIEEGYAETKAKELATYDEVCITKSGLLSTYKYVSYRSEDQKSYEDAVRHYAEQPTVHAEDCIFYPPVMGKSGDPVLVNGELRHNVTVGDIHELQSWDQVNCNDYTSCVKGLHLGSQTYIQCYGGSTKFLLNCLVSPSDIGAIVHSSVATADKGALRVLRYYVISVNIAANRNRYHESTLLDKIDEVWEEERTKAIHETNLKIKQFEEIKLNLESI